MLIKVFPIDASITVSEYHQGDDCHKVSFDALALVINV